MLFSEKMRLLLKNLFISLQNATESEFLIFIRWLRYIIQPRLSPEQQILFSEDLDRINSKECLKMVFENLEKSWDAFKDEGLKEGLKEGREKTALEMLRDNFDIEKISKYTKLSIERIHELRKML